MRGGLARRRVVRVAVVAVGVTERSKYTSDRRFLWKGLFVRESHGLDFWVQGSCSIGCQFVAKKYNNTFVFELISEVIPECQIKVTRLACLKWGGRHTSAQRPSEAEPLFVPERPVQCTAVLVS